MIGKEWNGKKVLVTGADGFIGSHLVEHLLQKGAHVRALSFYNSFNHWGWMEDIPPHANLEVVTGDIRDIEQCRHVTQNIDTIFHLAALIAIPYSYQAPRSFLDTNISGTFNICNAAIASGCSKLIHVSSSEVYGTARYVPIDESHPLQPQSPYSASKISSEAIALSHYYSYDLPVTIVRPFNTFGPRQSARAVIPSIIIQLAQGNKVISLGKLSPRRDFNYVQDTCLGLSLIAENNNLLGETVNIGSGKDYSIQEVLSRISTLMRCEVDFTIDEQRIRPVKSEVERLLCDNSKIKQCTGFRPQYTLEAGLVQSISWYSDTENLKKFKSHIYNV